MSPGRDDPMGGGAGADEPAERAVKLAARYLERIARGEEPDLEVTAEELSDEALRDQFRRLIGDARTVQELLPVQVRPGMILSGRYRVGQEIGSGGMGRVYRAFDRRLERTVAIKVLSLPGASSFDAPRQFRREAVMLANLQHGNIVAVHEIAADGDVNYIVMDLVQGMPLDEVISRARQLVSQAPGRRAGLMRTVLGPASDAAPPGPADEGDWYRAVARVLRVATQTIEVAHAAGLVHRDIKPKNVMLRRDGSPVLLDFGLAGAVESGGSDGVQGLFGTTSYLAPEQVSSGHVGNDPRSDVYQLGVLLHELLSLAHPFQGDGRTRIMQQISQGAFRRPREFDRTVPFELEAICLCAMETDVRYRYQSAHALREDVDRWLGGVELPLAARGGRLGRLVRGSRYAVRRHKVAAAAGAALLVGGLVGGLLWVGGADAGATIEPFCYQASTGRTILDQGIVAVRPGDQVGVTIDTPEPLFVYVLSVFGQPDPPTWIAPMGLVPVMETFVPRHDDGRRPEHHPFGGTTTFSLRVPPGRTQVVCTAIGDYDPASRPYEGLWVFTCREPHADLEAWLDALDSRARGSERGGVNYEDARQLFAKVVAGGPTGPSTRGGSPAPLTPEKARAMADSLTAAMLLGESDWPFNDPKRWSAVWPVQP